MTVTHAQFLEEVRRAIGTPVVHMGRRIGRALDCVGLPWAACLAVGMEMDPTPVYDSLPSAEELSDGLSSYCDPVDEGGHLWQTFVGREARHVVVPSRVNDCGQQLVIEAWGDRRQVREVLFTRPRRIAQRWNIRGVV